MNKGTPGLCLVVLASFMFIYPGISGAGPAQDSAAGGGGATPSFSTRVPDGSGGQMKQGAPGVAAPENIQAQGAAAVAITQNTDTSTITSGNSVSCNAGGLHADNSYFRRFDLDGAHGLTKTFSIESVDIGIEKAVGSTGSQPVEVKLYAIANSNPLTLANLNPIGSASVAQADASLTVQNFPVSGTINPLTDDLVVELFTPSGQTLNNSFFIGSNAAGQSAPSYILAAACGVTEITNIAFVGFPNMHTVMVVTTAAGKFPWPMFLPATNGAGAR